MSFGDPEVAWAACAAVSAQTHIRYLDRPVRRVVSLIPEKYDDMWTAAKGFYKVEPVVADGGEVIIYAPHITQISAMHPEINEIGYHCRDYFTAQWDRFSHLHWGVLAHSTHLRGAGTYDDVHGERLRVTVTLATGHPGGRRTGGEPRTTSTRPRSTWPRSATTPTPWSSLRPARCCSGLSQTAVGSTIGRS